VLLVLLSLTLVPSLVALPVRLLLAPIVLLLPILLLLKGHRPLALELLGTESLLRVLDDALTGLRLIKHGLLLRVREFSHLHLEVLDLAEYAVHLLVVLELYLDREPDGKLVKHGIRKGVDLLYQFVKVLILQLELSLGFSKFVHVSNNLLSITARARATEYASFTVLLGFELLGLYPIVVIPSSLIFASFRSFHHEFTL
jgi:hypothetical protein